jgi:hypothetical protein
LLHSDALRQRSTSVAFGAKRTLAKPRCQSYLYTGNPIRHRANDLPVKPPAPQHRGALAVSDERADAHDDVVDVLGEAAAESLANVRVWLTNEVVGGCPGRSGTVSRSQTMTVDFI